MRYRGRHIDPVRLWSRYTDVQEGEPPFLPLCMCPNPEHDATKPHFQINIEKPLVHCFSGCGISGTYEHAISIIEGCSLDEARKIILRGTSAPGRRGRKIQRPASNVVAGGKEEARARQREVRKVLDRSSYLPPDASDYLAGRGLSPAVVARWKLGFDPDTKRIVIPALDNNYNPRFLIQRAIYKDNWPKYLYSEGADRGNFLFGACFLDRSLVQSDGLVVVEGSLDTIRMHQNGQENTVGILGSSITSAQARMIENLRPKRVILLFDKDAAGVNAIFKARKALPKTPIYVGRYPKGKSDPAELTGKEVDRVITKAMPYLRFQTRMKEVGVGT